MRLEPLSNRCVAVLFALGIGLSHASPASADDDPGAELLEQGIALRREGRDAEALEAFRQAFAASPSPRARAQVALAEQALGQWVAAEADLLAALEAHDDPWIARFGPVLHHALGIIQAHLGRLEVDTNVPGAELWINAARAATLPTAAPVRVASGELVLEARAPGFGATRDVVHVAPGQTLHDVLTLVPLAKAPVADAALVPPARDVRPVTAHANEAHPLTTQRTVAYASLTTGGLLLLGAVAAQIVREKEASFYGDDHLCFYGNLSREARCGSHREAADTAQVLANVGYVGAGIAVATGLVLWLTESPRGPTTARAIAPCRGAGPLAIVCGGTF